MDYRGLSRKRFLGGAAGGSLSAAGGSVAFGAPLDTYTLRMNVSTPADAVLGRVGLQYAAAVQRRSNGRLKIDVFPSLQLATEQGAIDALVSGSLDLAIQTTVYVAALVPQFLVFDMPFMFRDLAAGDRVMQSSVGQELLSILESKGIVGLTSGCPGFKEIETLSRPVVVPADMKGLRMRIDSGQVKVETYRALGAIPVVIDLSETYTALSQHTIDGIDVSLDSFASRKMYTLVKHVAMANHYYPLTMLLASKRKFDALPVDLQRMMKDEAKALGPFWRTITDRQTAEAVTMLKSNGVAFTEIQYPAFRKAMDPVYATFRTKLGGDLLDGVSRAAGA